MQMTTHQLPKTKKRQSGWRRDVEQHLKEGKELKDVDGATRGFVAWSVALEWMCVTNNQSIESVGCPFTYHIPGSLDRFHERHHWATGLILM